MGIWVFNAAASAMLIAHWHGPRQSKAYDTGLDLTERALVVLSVQGIPAMRIQMWSACPVRSCTANPTCRS